MRRFRPLQPCSECGVARSLTVARLVIATGIVLALDRFALGTFFRCGIPGADRHLVEVRTKFKLKDCDDLLARKVEPRFAVDTLKKFAVETLKKLVAFQASDWSPRIGN